MEPEEARSPRGLPPAGTPAPPRSGHGPQHLAKHLVPARTSPAPSPPCLPLWAPTLPLSAPGTPRRGHREAPPDTTWRQRVGGSPLRRLSLPYLVPRMEPLTPQGPPEVGQGQGGTPEPSLPGLDSGMTRGKWRREGLRGLWGERRRREAATREASSEGPGPELGAHLPAPSPRCRPARDPRGREAAWDLSTSLQSGGNGRCW